ncbi:tRNA (guanosine(37)-N1)-methyltransferase TrmD [Thermospira aquatica]|uniref:tRNA (guanine-N(1)-)-methyltransferase n=1 Tax=Thermospira aquatica TaxID=2828656 RepID=A0AAX3BAV5_9SPIR|nr:tRNA (guanosine(37)-N1)-methyltransferase TrmD [Thermospira aquatica]URA09383.1 tRNA (guanosine(37)-N1)-methyltransferase TrmD [Thermospira aquatica]
MRFDVVTIFPELIEAYLQKGILKRAIEEKRVSVMAHQLRDFSPFKGGRVDAPIVGHGKGMLFRPEPLAEAVRKLRIPGGKVVLMSPQGERLSAKMARELSVLPQLILIAARYEGVDARFVRRYVDREVSIGDFVLMGGELPALCVIEAVTRFVGEVLESEAVEGESFEAGLLEHDHYTEPDNFEGLGIPEVLKSGHHQQVTAWRHYNALAKTYLKRPDLFGAYEPLWKERQGSFLKVLRRQNEEMRKFLTDIQKIVKEWKDGREHETE